ncbi:hypothetical protein AVEN_204345-1 [Araneus ventricosus]|uniref:Uncharacterized protein n=1 Tax=Araneus ventricosus TaxID=182803 RepID=A0A4Y2MVC5_ARAVE|nr:hypothetical protein AVEN_204345-1 [Araneus ventricosus]
MSSVRATSSHTGTNIANCSQRSKFFYSVFRLTQRELHSTLRRIRVRRSPQTFNEPPKSSPSNGGWQAMIDGSLRFNERFANSAARNRMLALTLEGPIF